MVKKIEDMTGIIGALEEETSMLKKDMEIKNSCVIAGCEFVSGVLNGRDIVITRCGMGKVNAAACTAAMISSYSPDIIISTGVGGSLDDSISVFDIMIATDVVQHDYDLTSLGYPPAQVDRFDSPYFVCDKKISNAIKKSAEQLGYTSHFARFATGDRFIDLPEDKNRLAEAFGARVCDMETGAIAQVCALHGVRFAGIRTISDSSSGESSAAQFQKFLSQAAAHSVSIVENILKTW